jgi:hypothetical protein
MALTNKERPMLHHEAYSHHKFSFVNELKKQQSSSRILQPKLVSHLYSSESEIPIIYSTPKLLRN